MNGEAIMVYGTRVYKNAMSIKYQIRVMLREYKRTGKITKPPIKTGSLGVDVIKYAKREGIDLASNILYFTPRFVAHSQRESKGNKRVKIDDLATFHIRKGKMDKYYDGECFIFTDYKTKYIVHPNQYIKTSDGKRHVANLVTAGIVTDENEFKGKRYKKI